MISEKMILVVEDNLINRAMLCAILSSKYKVLEAENGQEALEQLNRYGEEISLILLDIVMPVMDGYEFLSIVKKDASFSSIPIIVTTQSDREADEVAALSHGASDFVAKPYKPQIILHRVESIIHLRETAAMINLIQHDRLTGLYSKEFFYRQVRNTLIEYPDKEFDIIYSDIENFKLVNDVFGIPAGDRLLCGVADMYKNLVGENGICGRFNADQFACLIEHRDLYDDELFIQATAEINRFTNAKNVIMKWGIYSIKDINISVEQMCDRALLAARSIKGQYGKYFAVYDDKLRSKLLREQAITDNMEPALAQGQFEIYLQPKYRIKDGLLSGAEALVRWKHPQWGMQSPGEFIPLFEKNGFITKLDEFVWDRTCAVLSEWDAKGYPRIPVSVNVSRADIYNADLPEILINIVNKYKLAPSRLHLEITESAYTENPGQIIDTVGHFRELGFIIEMDDFGSGYSSLNMLNKMPLDILKLDMKFIQSETAKPVNQGILRFIMGLARWMNLEVVAEGVETKNQLERLQEIGCDYVQGYYFAKPMPCAEFTELLKSQQEASPQQHENIKTVTSELNQILVVADEDEEYRALVRSTFESRYKVVEAADGETALGYIASYENKIAAVLLSLTLEGPDGLSVLKVLNREKPVWNISVVATAPADAELEQLALELGADDFAAKPHQQASLYHRVLRAVNFAVSQERERSLQDEVYRDFQTGLLNRRGLEAAVNTLLKEDAPLAVYLFDLDNLKDVNDTYGHNGGDQLINRFALILRSHTRGTDIVARFGGDEFVVIMKHMKTKQNAVNKGEEICSAAREICFADGIRAAASAGIVFWDGEEPVMKVIERADQALYLAKNSNKGGYVAQIGAGVEK